jgi:hypothetical protein
MAGLAKGLRRSAFQSPGSKADAMMIERADMRGYRSGGRQRDNAYRTLTGSSPLAGGPIRSLKLFDNLVGAAGFEPAT